LEKIKMALSDAVDKFGENRVFSNVIVGLGESDRALQEGIEELVEMGVLPVIRAVYPHPLRRDEIEMIRPSPERLIDLARFARRILDEHGLRGDLAETGCYRCTGCDLIPHRDL
jgi:biotin synthase-related radical SAM superfamily protein